MFGAGVAEFTGYNLRELFWDDSITAAKPEITVYFYVDKTKSEFELSRNGRTLLSVQIPHIKEPVNPLVISTGAIRTVNTGSGSMTNATLTTIEEDVELAQNQYLYIKADDTRGIQALEDLVVFAVRG